MTPTIPAQQPKRRGNPNWGKPFSLEPITISTFESLVTELKLSPDQYEHSATLRKWAGENKDRKYVPPELLRVWGLRVNREI